MTDPLPAVSIVVPAFNEVESVALLAAELLPLAPALKAEVIVVDDGSTDGTAAAVSLHPGFRLVRIPHTGKTGALRAGIEAARAPLIVTIDADLQEDPAHIPQLLEALADGADMVSGCRALRADSWWRKRFPSAVFRFLLRLLFGARIRDINCGLRAARKRTFLSALPFEGAHRFVPLLVRRRGGAIREIPVAHQARRYGRPKYESPVRFVQALRDLLRIARLPRGPASLPEHPA